VTAPLSRARKSNPLRILFIEDSATDAFLLSGRLQEVTEFAFEMEHVTSLAEGLERVATRQFDAVILDLSLPDSRGLSTYETMRKLLPETVPVIIVSGNDDRAILNQVMQEGADNYLVKGSFDGNRIAVAILSSMRNRSVRPDSAQHIVIDQ
jgi:DNA-binding NarL/FixJ family response regulator